LCAIAERARPTELRRSAAARAVDPVTLARAHPEIAVRLRAVASVTDQVVLLEVVQTDPDSSVRRAAAAHLIGADRARLEEAERVALGEFRTGRWEWDPDGDERKRMERAQLFTFPD